MMQISDVKICFIQQPQDGLIGFASMVLGQSFYVSGIAIHERLNGEGHRLTYPTKKSGDQIFNICHPINRQLSGAIERTVFEKLKAVINEGRNSDAVQKTNFS